jgi:signal transduction histidine kinase
MHDVRPCHLGPAIAERLRASRDDIVRRWLDRITARVAIAPGRVFPTDELLNHMPLLVDGIAALVAAPDADIDAEVPVTAKARELGALRYAQGFDAYQVLKEHELLGAIVLAFVEEVVEEVVDGVRAGCAPRELVACLRRVAHAVELIRQATTVHFLELAGERVRAREDQLRRFNRLVSHELKNRVGAIRGAAALLHEPWLSEGERARFHRMVSENADGLQHVLGNLESLSRIEADARQHRHVLLPHAAAEAVRQLRDAAAARGVAVRVAGDLPAVEVDAAATELCLTNYVSNAIKYADPARDDRWVELTGTFHPREAGGGGGELRVEVRDNGVGVPPAERARLFEQFYRAGGGTVTGAEGTGLGLSLVRETVEALGGRAWADFPDAGGATFGFALPSRRAADAAAAGITRAG